MEGRPVPLECAAAFEMCSREFQEARGQLGVARYMAALRRSLAAKGEGRVALPIRTGRAHYVAPPRLGGGAGEEIFGHIIHREADGAAEVALACCCHPPSPPAIAEDSHLGCVPGQQFQNSFSLFFTYVVHQRQCQQNACISVCAWGIKRSAMWIVHAAHNKFFLNFAP